MNNHRANKDDNDTKSPTGIAAWPLIRSVRRRLHLLFDDTSNDGETNNDQKNYSSSERLYDLCSRYKFRTNNDTIIDPVLVALGIHQLVKSRGDSWDEHRPYLIQQILTQLRCKCLCEDDQHDDMLHSTCYQEFIGQVLDMYPDLRQDDEFTENSLISISGRRR